MIIKIEKDFTKLERLKAVRDAYTQLGTQLYEKVQKSQIIEESMKNKLKKKICIEYARQKLEKRLLSYNEVDIEYEFVEGQAIWLGEKIANMSENDYCDFLREIDRINKNRSDVIESLSSKELKPVQEKATSLRS